MKIPFALVSLVLATLVGPFAAAQTPAVGAPAPASSPTINPTVTTAPVVPAAPAISPEQLAAAKTLMQSMRFAQTLQKVLDSRKDGMVRMIDQSTMMMPAGSAAPAELAAYKKDMLDTYLAEMSPQAALDGMAKVYATLFTVDELKGMSDFYASPAGQALVNKTFDLQQKSAEVLQNQMQIVMPKLQAKQKAFVGAHPAKTPPTPPAALTPAAAAPAGAATPTTPPSPGPSPTVPAAAK